MFKGETERGSHALILWDLCLSLFLLWGYSWITWRCGSESGGSGKRPSVSLLKLAQAITGRRHNFCIPSFEISFLFIKAAQEDECHSRYHHANKMCSLTDYVFFGKKYLIWQISDGKIASPSPSLRNQILPGDRSSPEMGGTSHVLWPRGVPWCHQVVVDDSLGQFGL